MTKDGRGALFVFPRWTNLLRPLLAVTAVAAPVYIVLLVWLGASPRTQDVGYQPAQPVPYSHALHAGDLGIDCRYCHNTVEVAAKAAVPPTQTCMNCHAKIRTASPKLTPIRESYATGMPVPWVRVHDLADFVYFNHSAHVNKGVGCTTCHGPVDKMSYVWQEKSLLMEWCLDCHRQPEKYLRPKGEVYSVAWKPPANQLELGRKLAAEYRVKTQVTCSTCHR